MNNDIDDPAIQHSFKKKTGYFLIVIGGIVVLITFTRGYYRFTLIYNLIWLVLPLVSFLTRFLKSPLKTAWIARVIFTVVAVTISSLALVNFDRTRDAIGYKFIPGYSVEYEPETDDFGLPQISASISADHWSYRLYLWAGEWMLVAACFGVPYATWKLGTERNDTVREIVSEGDD